VPSDFGSAQHVSAGYRARVWLGPAHLPLAGRPNPLLPRLAATRTYPYDGVVGPRLSRGSRITGKYPFGGYA